MFQLASQVCNSFTYWIGQGRPINLTKNMQKIRKLSRFSKNLIVCKFAGLLLVNHSVWRVKIPNMCILQHSRDDSRFLPSTAGQQPTWGNVTRKLSLIGFSVIQMKKYFWPNLKKKKVFPSITIMGLQMLQNIMINVPNMFLLHFVPFYFHQ